MRQLAILAIEVCIFVMLSILAVSQITVDIQKLHQAAML